VKFGGVSTKFNEKNVDAQAPPGRPASLRPFSTRPRSIPRGLSLAGLRVRACTTQEVVVSAVDPYASYPRVPGHHAPAAVINGRQDHNFRVSESLEAAGPHASLNSAVRGDELGKSWGKVPRVLISNFAYANANSCCGDLLRIRTLSWRTGIQIRCPKAMVRRRDNVDVPVAKSWSGTTLFRFFGKSERVSQPSRLLFAPRHALNNAVVFFWVRSRTNRQDAGKRKVKSVLQSAATVCPHLIAFYPSVPDLNIHTPTPGHHGRRHHCQGRPARSSADEGRSTRQP
jgi:hypothetical protein